MIRELYAAAQGQEASRRRRPGKRSVVPGRLDRVREAGDPEALNEGKHVYHVTRAIDPHCAMPIAARQLVLNALSARGEVLASASGGGITGQHAATGIAVATRQISRPDSAECRIPTVICERRWWQGVKCRLIPTPGQPVPPSWRNTVPRLAGCNRIADIHGTRDEHAAPQAHAIRCWRKTFCGWTPNALTAC